MLVAGVQRASSSSAQSRWDAVFDQCVLRQAVVVSQLDEDAGDKVSPVILADLVVGELRCNATPLGS